MFVITTSRRAWAVDASMEAVRWQWNHETRVTPQAYRQVGVSPIRPVNDMMIDLVDSASLRPPSKYEGERWKSQTFRVQSKRPW
jgi:hypothetical protein